MESDFDAMYCYDGIFYLSDRKLCRHLTKITSTQQDLMVEFFKTSTFNLIYKDKLIIPEDAIEQQRNKVEQQDKKQKNNFQTLPDEIDATNNSRISENKDDDNLEDVVSLNLLTSWIKKDGSDICRAGGTFAINDNLSNPVRFEMFYRQSNNKKCVRCRRYTVLDGTDDGANICDRCQDAVEKLELFNR